MPRKGVSRQTWQIPEANYYVTFSDVRYRKHRIIVLCDTKRQANDVVKIVKQLKHFKNPRIAKNPPRYSRYEGYSIQTFRYAGWINRYAGRS